MNMENVQVTVNGKAIEITRGTTLEELSKSFQDHFKYEIILAKVDGIYEELTMAINRNCEIEFLDLTEKGANQVYLNGLIYLTVYATKKLFGNQVDIKVNFKKSNIYGNASDLYTY